MSKKSDPFHVVTYYIIWVTNSRHGFLVSCFLETFRIDTLGHIVVTKIGHYFLDTQYVQDICISPLITKYDLF